MSCIGSIFSLPFPDMPWAHAILITNISEIAFVTPSQNLLQNYCDKHNCAGLFPDDISPCSSYPKHTLMKSPWGTERGPSGAQRCANFDTSHWPFLTSWSACAEDALKVGYC